MSESTQRLTSLKCILEAYVKSGVGMRRENSSLLAGDVSRATVFVADSIPDLQDDRVLDQTLL